MPLKNIAKKFGSLCLAVLLAAGNTASLQSVPIHAEGGNLKVYHCTGMHGAAEANNPNTQWKVHWLSNHASGEDFHMKMELDGKLVYCIEPFVPLAIGASVDGKYYPISNYSEIGGEEALKKLSREQMNRIALISSLGYGFNGVQSNEMHFATQMLIWEAAGSDPDTSRNAYAAGTGVRQAYDTIKERLRIAETPVDFGTTEVRLKDFGKENAVTLTDKNGVFQHYVGNPIQGVHSEKNGNSLTIWAEKGDSLNATMAFDCFWLSNEVSDDIPAIIYGKANSQTVAYIKSKPDPNTTMVKVSTAPKGTLELSKEIAYKEAQRSLLKEGGKGVSGIGFSVTTKQNITLDNGQSFNAGELVRGLSVEGGKEDENGNYVFTSGEAKGTMKFSGLPVGSYTMKETIQHEGLVTNHKEYSFTVNENGQTVWDESGGIIVNETTAICSSKLDELQQHIYGAHMQVLDKNGNVADSWTTNGDKHCLEGLKPGEYILHEDKAPEGFVEAEDIPFTVEDNGNIISHDMLDDVQHIEKIDQFNRRVNGAHLQIKDGEGNIVDDFITGQQIAEIPADSFQTYSETGQASWNGKLNIIPNSEKERTLDDEYTLTLGRKAEIEEDILPFDHQVTIKDPEKLSPYIGKAVLKEAKKAIKEGREAGNIQDDDFDRLNSELKALEDAIESGSQNVAKETNALKNHLIEIGIYVGNTDNTATDYGNDTENPAGDSLNAEMVLRAVAADGEAWYFDVDEDGIETAHRASGLKIGNTYTLEEVAAPDKYIVSEPVEFTVQGEGKLETVRMYDVKTDDVSISKKDATDKEELPGAELTVTDKNGNVVDKWTSTNEEHLITGLIVGEEYTLTEVIAPNGYELAESITFVIQDNGEMLQHVEMFDTRKPETKERPRTGTFETGLSSKEMPFIIGGAVVIVIGAAAVIVVRKRRND